MSDFAAELARLMAARPRRARAGPDGAVQPRPHLQPAQRQGPAFPELAETLDERLAAGGMLRALAPVARAGCTRRDLDDSAIAEEIAALDLGRQAEASRVGSGTVERLELAVDDLATAYPGTRPPSCWTACAAISVTSPGCSTPRDAG